MRVIQLPFLILLVAFVCATGCTKPKQDPLAGWSFCFSQDPAKLDKLVQDDYRDYIEKLPATEKKFAYYAHCFENGTGQHAIQIEILLNGTWWEHVLFYDKDNKRVKTIKYSRGGYRS